MINKAPDLIVVYESNPNGALFEGIATVDATAPRPVVVFTSDPDAEKIATATRSGIHAYVVNGYSQNRLRSVVHLAQARFRHERAIRQQLADVNQRFTERKLVDRARGILMGARQLREEEAYRALRSAAMHGKQRIGQVAQRVIESARYAEAINRAGQLRMLSQRLAKLYAFACAKVRPDETERLLAEATSHAESNLGNLARNLSRPTFGDLLDGVVADWQRLQSVLAGPADSARLGEMDRLAGRMLESAERLTANLEIANFAAELHVINVAGRQRMLSQRLAKEAMVGVLLGAAAKPVAELAMAATTAELMQGLDYLRHLPLSNPEIDRELAAMVQTWATLEASLPHLDTADGRDTLAALSEALLSHFERLTDGLERGMHSLVY